MELDVTKGTVAALGSFDGLHIGHMAVLNAARQLAEETGAVPVICTFKEHPLKVLTGMTPPALMEGEVKEEVYATTGMQVYHMDFASIKDMSPEDFFQKILVEELNVKGICCGFNFSFGAKGAGNPELLQELCAASGIRFYASPAMEWKGAPISSTRIRAAVESGDLDLANEMLGRPFRFRERVEKGYGRGHTWGIPTINQMFPEELVIPKFGVYFSECEVNGARYYGATNIGLRPTVDDGKAPSSETFILDFEGDLYGEHVDISLLKFLRPEQKFPSFDALKEQIMKDIETVRTLAENRD